MTSSTGSTTTPILFAGGYYDTESGLYYLINRYYDPATAQFLNVDPLVDLTSAPYRYAGDNPTNVSDPLGLFGFSSIVKQVARVSHDAGDAVSAASLVAVVVGGGPEDPFSDAVAYSLGAVGSGLSTYGDIADFVVGQGSVSATVLDSLGALTGGLASDANKARQLLGFISNTLEVYSLDQQLGGGRSRTSNPAENTSPCYA